MKPQRINRMVIAYIDKKVHKNIRIYCLKNGITLAEWARLANEQLSTQSK